jgi:hypothetical protein
VRVQTVIPITVTALRLSKVARREMRVAVRGDAPMDATYFRDKAETCLRLAKGLSWNNPARAELMELAEEFLRQAEELDAEQPPAIPT